VEKLIKRFYNITPVVRIGAVLNTGIFVNHLIKTGGARQTLAHFWTFAGGTGRVALLTLEFGSDIIAN
jgi:hypothetical protein